MWRKTNRGTGTFTVDVNKKLKLGIKGVEATIWYQRIKKRKLKKGRKRIRG